MRTSPRSLLVFACCALLLAGHAAATLPPHYAYADEYPYAQDDDPDGLLMMLPGEFLWLPGSEAESDAPVTLFVSLSEQRGYLYREGERIAVTTVSTGKPGYDTPTGVFPITEKKVTHYSNRYNNAPMPFMQRLTDWGHALHAGQVRETPASHGCVRLPPEFAQQLFSLTKRGDLVVIARDHSMVSLERAGVDSQVAQLVGGISRRQPVPENALTRIDEAPAPSAAGADLGSIAF